MKGIQIRNKTPETGEILIYEDIGAGFWTEGITAAGFLRDLRGLGNVRNLDVRINSNGGSVFDGVAIYNALRQHPARKTVHVDGLAASIASIIAMAGDEIRMGEGAWMMIHDPSGLAMGTAEQMRETADLLDGIKDQLIAIYALRTGHDEAAIADMMAAETWMDAATALDKKFADTLAEPVRLAAHVDRARFRNIPSALHHGHPSAPPGPTEQQDQGAAQAALSISTPKKGITMSIMETLQARASEHQAAATAVRAKANAENRDLTDAERTVITSHLDAFETAQADILMQRKLEDAEAWLTAPAGRKVQPDGLANTHLRTGQEKNRWGFNNLGEFAKSVRSAIIGSGTDPRLVQNASLSTYGNEETGADGGFAVPPDFRTEIQALVMGEASMLMQCDAVPTASNRVTFPTDESTAWQTSGGVLAYWGSEAGAMTQSKPALKEVGVTLHKLYAMVPVTDEMLEDTPMMSRYLTGKAGEKLDFAVTDAIVNGTGVGKPLGILTAPATVSIAKESGQAAATIVGANILKMYARQLNPGRSVWLVNADTLAQILSLNIEFKSSAGAAIAAGARFPTISFPGENGNTFATIMGRPVLVSEACQTLGTVGDILFVDLKGGYFAPYKAGGIRNDISMHLWFDQGVTAFRWTMRVGGQPWLSAAVSPKNGSATRSSMVSLATR